MVYANVVELNSSVPQQSTFWCALQGIKESFTSIDRFEIQLSEELRKMRDERLFVEGGYKSFEEFCNKELSQWGGYRRVNQLLGFGQVAAALRGTEFDGVVSKESHARPVLRLLTAPEKLKEAVAIASGENPNPTAKDFRAAAEKVAPIPRRTKVQEQLFLTGAEVKVSDPDHPRVGQTGTVSGDPPNNTHLFIVFSDSEQSELIAINDLDAPSTPFTPRKYPKEYEEAIAQLKQQHQEELRRIESDVRTGLLSEAEERAKELVREHLAASQAIASTKALEVAKLQQKVDELESLRTLEVENQQLQQRIEGLERALESRPMQEWGNTLTKQAQKSVNAEVIRMVENLEPELHLRSLAIDPPTTNQSTVVRLLGLSLEAVSQSMPKLATELRKAAAIVLEVDEISLEKKAQQLRQLPEAIASIKSVLGLADADWTQFTEISDNYELIKQEIWLGLSVGDREKVNQMSAEFYQPMRECWSKSLGKKVRIIEVLASVKKADVHIAGDAIAKPRLPFSDLKPLPLLSAPVPDTQSPVPSPQSQDNDSPWMLTPQTWQSGGRSCKYIKMSELSLLFNDENWLLISSVDQEKFINPRTWLDFWKEGKVTEGAIAHADINKQAYTYHGVILGVNPVRQEVQILWQEISDPRWYEASDLRVREVSP